jgi:mRNA interferase MazF
MPTTTAYEFGDVVLVPFPFTDQTGSKQRPAVVVSSARYNDERPDLVIMAVTSQLRPPGVAGDVAIVHWRAAGLLKSSVIKPVITTIERSLVRRKLGRLEAHDRASLGDALRELLGP